jgi:hypothetical protein
MTKILYILLISFSINAFADGERHESKEADEDSFGSMCPEDRPTNRCTVYIYDEYGF